MTTTDTTTKTKPDLRLTWTTKYSYEDIMVFKALVGYMVTPDHPGDTGLRNPRADRWDSEGTAQYDNLAITAQIDSGKENPTWYAARLVYSEPYEVDLIQAERMVKLMRRLTKALDKFDTQFGRPEDLAAFCGRVATALGCSTDRPFGEYSKELTINGTHYRWTDIDGLRSRLDDTVTKRNLR
jgi:hypothetical protein